VRAVSGHAEAVPSPAATLIVTRQGACGPEFLLLKRSAAARFMPNAFVFPGGAVDAADGTELAYASCAGLDDGTASQVLGVPRQGLSYFIAALRETFEECGLLYAYVRGDSLAGGEEAAALRAEASGASLPAQCTSRGWRLAVDRLIYFAHWITPRTLARRFDTRFFLAQAPDGQQAALTSNEMQELVWLGAREALQRHAREELLLVLPTKAMLEEMAPFDRVAALLRHAGAARLIRAVMPED